MSAFLFGDYLVDVPSMKAFWHWNEHIKAFSYNSYLTLKKLENMSLSLHYTLEDAIVSKILRVISHLLFVWKELMVTLDMSFNNKIGFQDLKLNYNFKLTIGSYISMHSSRYEARGKFGEHERCARVV